MSIKKPEVVGYIAKRDLEYDGCRLGPVCMAADSWPGSVALIRLSEYEALMAECEKLRKDAERIEWLEEQTKKSRTGISFDYHRHVEDGYVIEHGYRFMRRHFASGFKDSLRKAIDSAMQEGNE